MLPVITPLSAPQKRAGIPRTVWVLGLVSFFMDVSSEMIHALLPLFLTAGLGASVALVGLIDGVAESTAAVSKVFSGYLSDRIERRKPLIFLGYGLGALAKPLFATAGSPLIVFAARFIDRIGKGVRGSPRDALVADVTPVEIRGSAYGLRQALDTAGAFSGPLLAVVLMLMFANDMRAVFWVAAIPAFLAAACVFFAVEDRPPPKKSAATPLRIKDLAGLNRTFWIVIAIGVAFSLARFSEAFLILKANREGLPLALTPFALAAMNVFYMLGSYPAGALSDRRAPRSILLAGLAALVTADLALALSTGLAGVFAGIGLWGVHMALTQGLLAKLVADAAPQELRGTAFGAFHLATGVALLFASLIAGILWDRAGSSATFLASAFFAALAAALVIVATRRRLKLHRI